MTLAVDLQPELEVWLREEARKRGTDPSSFVVETIEERWRRDLREQTRPGSGAKDAESELLKLARQPIPDEIWKRFRALARKRRAETITADEQDELLKLSDLVERLHADRLMKVAELSRLREVPFMQLMDELGIKPRRL